MRALFSTVIWTIIVASSACCSASSADETAAAAIGQYSLRIDLDEVNVQSAEVIGTARMEVSLPAGKGFVAIPTPFALSDSQAVIIEPTSTYAAVIHGDLRPESRFGVFLVNLSPGPTHIRLVARRARFYLESTSESESGKALKLSIGQAYSAARQSLPEMPLALLNQLRIRSDFVAETSPESVPTDGTGRERVFEFASQSDRAIDFVIYLRPTSSLFGLYFLLGAAGLLLGFLSSMPLAPSAGKAKWVLALCLLALSVLALVFVFALNPKQRLYDTTTVVTTGMVAGALIGLICGALWTLVKSRSVGVHSITHQGSRPTTPAHDAQTGDPPAFPDS